mgnify:CR=1 FL=1
MLLGKGPVYKEKREKHDAALQELQDLKEANNQKIETLEQQIVTLNSSYETHVADSQPFVTPLWWF